MKLNLRTVGFSLLMLTSLVVKADHTSPSGSVARLQYEAQELAQGVRYFGLNYNVIQAVDRFNYDVARLGNCVGMGGVRSSIGEHGNVAEHLDGPMIRDHMDHVGVPYQCQGSLDMVRRSFFPVERYLHDTYYDFPQIYRNYQETREALYSIQVGGGFPGPMPGPSPYPGPGPQPGPGPGMGKVSCVAVDVGWEEHGGGHVGYGRMIGEAQRAALMTCQQFHGRCRIRECR